MVTYRLLLLPLKCKNYFSFINNFSYKMYRFLFRICPTPIVDMLTVRFCAMPTYQNVKG